MTEEFSWLSFFEELLSKICTNSDPEKLYNVWNKFFPDKYSSVDNDDNVPLNKIDPLSFIGKITSLGDEELTKKCTELKSIFSLNSSIPSNYNGIPRLNRTNCLFWKEYWKNRKNENDLDYLDYVINTLWDFAKDLNNKTNSSENLQIKNMDTILNFCMVGINKLSQIIFLVKPQIYYSCDNKSLSYLNISITDNKDYNEFLEIQNISKETGKKPFELSYIAELYSNKRKRFFRYLKPIEIRLSSYSNFINKQIYNENIEKEIFKIAFVRIYDVETEKSLNDLLSILYKNEEWKKYNKKHGNGIPNAILNTHYRNYIKGIDVSVEDNIPTWLLSWNPDKWSWTTFDENIQKLETGINVEEQYSCISKQPKVGDRAFLIKLGKDEPKGIIASGYISSEPFMGIAEHRKDNKEVNNVKIKFDKILNYKQNAILLQSKLKEMFPNQEWSIQSSGISIKKEYLADLENLWEQYNNKRNEQVNNNDSISLNQILYGPPGTGKTYNTVVEAIKILNKPLYDEYISNTKTYADLKNEFDTIKKQDRIEFVTFHQSYSYEEFVEGIKPNLNGDNLSYKLENGIFKNICDHAKPIATTTKHAPIDFSNTKVFKMSLGNTLEKEDDIYDYCIENNVVSLGWKDTDFSNCKTSQDFKSLDNSWGATALERFVKWMDIGDIIIISNGNMNFRAIAQVKSDYFYDNNTPISHTHFRKVEWLYKGEDIHYSKINNKSFSQQSIYGYFSTARKGQPDYNPDLKTDELNKIITGEINKEVSKPHILIIDEINRGNISKIFGELITLIEEDKRENLSVTLPYSKETFSVPKNLYIIGTMNTSDRSIASIDIALRRRFKFKEMMPQKELAADFGVGFGEIFEKLNTRIKILLDRDHQIGHSYFIKTKYNNEKGNNNIETLKNIWFSEIIPLLNEYFYCDWEKLKLIIPGFINKSKVPDNFQNECDEFLYEFKTFDEVTDFETALKQEKFE